ncbi:class I SAM-dependent methyltransferase family protein [Streptomyces sulphureus]|uniref:class I SAM-dependent methyltransferase family protein n=1 Tax=Streptomyces sulphureus TaxID=47758 RepID=UPI000368BF95|nr:class I SAM-dependent methyltransferase family protein [Streptomyces sulphureus]
MAERTTSRTTTDDGATDRGAPAGRAGRRPGEGRRQQPGRARESLPERLKWIVLRGLMRTAGRSSQGIALGHRYGFDSGPLLDYVYEDEAHGSFGIGRLLDRAFLDAVAWRAVRARQELLKEVLRKLVAEWEQQEVVLLDVAAGSGRYLLDLLEEDTDGRLRVVCRDNARTALAHGRRLAARRRLLEHPLDWEEGDAFAPRPLADRRAPDLVVVCGLYELTLDDEAVRESMSRLRELLAPGGALVFTTQTSHPQRELASHTLPNREGTPWRMACRTAEAVEAYAARAGFAPEGISTRTEETGLCAVTVARK